MNPNKLLPGSGTSSDDSNTSAEISRIKKKSALTMLFFFMVFGGWSVLASISGAVIASGFVVVETSARSIQHLTGGIVERILVTEGERVKAGSLLVKLNETQIRAQLQIQANEVDELLIRQARLDAEQLGTSEVVLPAALLPRENSPAIRRLLELEQIILASRIRVYEGQRAQLRERIVQSEMEGRGNIEQLESRKNQADLIQKEITELAPLVERQLVPRTRIHALQRDAARIAGEMGAIAGDIARGQARISETELQILQLEQVRRNEVTQEARDTATRLASATEKKIALEDQLNHIEIRSPVDGQILQLSVFTVGGVVRAGETLMRIVPDNERLEFDVRILPRDIDQVHIGQKASIRLSAANQQNTTTLEGHLYTVSPDLILEPATQQRYFSGRVRLAPSEVGRPEAGRLKPGMPVEVFIRTEERTPLSYLLRPLVEQTGRAFRER
ncbi:MAG: HlyD family type I secretion periplasmic adaptor subunit [Methylobacterium sp.]|nr:HlyD family type I secretion periplasmic adaptor subunit [Methylobacterium sp.]